MKHIVFNQHLAPLRAKDAARGNGGKEIIADHDFRCIGHILRNIFRLRADLRCDLLRQITVKSDGHRFEIVPARSGIDGFYHTVFVFLTTQRGERIARIKNYFIAHVKLGEPALLLVDIAQRQRAGIQLLLHTGKRSMEVDRVIMCMAEHTVFNRHAPTHARGMDQIRKARGELARAGARHKAAIPVGHIPAHLRQPAKAMHVVHVHLFNENIFALPVKSAGRFPRSGGAQFIHHAGPLDARPLAKIKHAHQVGRKLLHLPHMRKRALQKAVTAGNAHVRIIADNRPARVVVFLRPIRSSVQVCAACPQKFPAARQHEWKRPCNVKIGILRNALLPKAGHCHLADRRHGEIPGKRTQRDPFRAHDRQRH